jgi:hypothetical protein
MQQSEGNILEVSGRKRYQAPTLAFLDDELSAVNTRLKKLDFDMADEGVEEEHNSSKLAG